MGPVRQRHLISLLAFLVGLNLVVGGVVLSTRVVTALSTPDAPRTSRLAGRSTDPTNPGILAGGQFGHRRGPDANPAGPAAAPGASDSAARTATSTGATPPTGGPSRSRRGSTVSGGTARPAAGRPTTSTTGRPVTPAGGPTTSSTTGQTPAPTGGTAGHAPVTTPTTGAAKPGGRGPAASGGQGNPFDDGAGDTVAEGTGRRVTEGRADIVRSGVIFTPKAVVLTVQVGQPVDPRQDPHWASQSTYLGWEIDTNGDSKPDFDVQYFLDSGAPVAGVSRVGDTGGASACDAEAGYGPDGYTVAFAPDCLGSPSFSYRVSTFYDGNPADQNAPLVTDVAPDGGLSQPVARP